MRPRTQLWKNNKEEVWDYKVECPDCGHRNPEEKPDVKESFATGSKRSEKCKFSRLTKTSDKIYWIEYRGHGRRKRERIGPSKAAGEARLLEVQKALVEDKLTLNEIRMLMKNLDQLFDWFLKLQEAEKNSVGA